MKQDNGKARWDLMEFKTLNEMAVVMARGAECHGDRSWRELDDGVERYFASAMRHLSAWRSGIDIDIESGQKHLAHAMCNIMFINELLRSRPEDIDSFVRKYKVKYNFAEGEGSI